MALSENFYAQSQAGIKEAGRKDKGYRYENPGFRPGKPLHDMIVCEVNACMQASKSYMQSRYTSMGETDELMTSFVRLSDLEKKQKARNQRAPVADVVPVCYAIGQTLHTQGLALYAAQENLYQFTPGGPEDVVGTVLAEKILQRQATHFKHLDAISIQLWDNIKYGFGCVMPVWETKMGRTTREVPQTQPDPMTGELIPTGTMNKVRESVVLYEGNNVRNVDPYRYFPDPSVSLNRTQDGEFEAWTSSMSRFKLIESEQIDPVRWMNAKYIEEIWGQNKAVRSVMESCFEVEQSEVGIAGKRRMQGSGLPGHDEVIDSNRVEVSFLVRTVIPREWEASDGTKLGDSEVPTKYLFGVAGDSLLIACHPLDLDHDMYPGCVMATDSDGYSCIARSPLEVTRPMMEAINYIYNIHMAFMRRFYKGRFMGDGTKFDTKAFLQGADFIPMERLAFGTKIADVLQQIPVQNVTGNYASDIGTLLEMIQRATGATDPILGMLSQGERKSATEAQGVLKNALGRMEKMVLLGAIQSHQDLAYKLLAQTQQFGSIEQYVRMAGRGEADLLMEYGKRQATQPGWAMDSRGFFPVSPKDLDVWADVMPLLPNKRGEQSFETWVSLLPTLTAIPGANVQAMVQHVMRLGGAQNASDFFTPMAPMQVMPNGQVQQQVQAGNMLPAQQAQAEGLLPTPEGMEF